MSQIEINEQFKRALSLMEETDKHLFITGKAGTGKSTLLSHFCKNTAKRPVVLAPTGVAALNVGGQTIHNFFRFRVDITPQKILERKVRLGKNRDFYKKLKAIIIDESSMLRADLLDCVDTFLRMYGPKRGQPFGGVQMVFIGDLYQLPPVVTSQERAIFNSLYKTPYFFSAKAMEGIELEVVELEKIYRQKDQDFIHLLNKVRNNSVEEEDMAKLNSRLIKDKSKKPNGLCISLTGTNIKADEINDAHLASLPGKPHVSEAEIRGDFGKEHYPTALELRFKAGAQIMLLNNDSSGRWVNGTIGVIEKIEEDEEGEECVLVRLYNDDGESEVVSVSRHKWEVYKFALEGGAIISQRVGSFTQYPFRLAWAVTIHKSQGKTFDNVEIDIGSGAFSAGQMYVALSRCTSFEGITLRAPLKKQHIWTDYRIFEFMTRRKYAEAEKALSTEDKIAFIKNAIKEKTALEIVYLKPDDTESKRVVRPMTVGKETYSGKSFHGMRAFCTTRKEERMFRVDRILKLNKTTA